MPALSLHILSIALGAISQGTGPIVVAGVADAVQFLVQSRVDDTVDPQLIQILFDPPSSLGSPRPVKS